MNRWNVLGLSLVTASSFIDPPRQCAKKENPGHRSWVFIFAPLHPLQMPMISIVALSADEPSKQKRSGQFLISNR